MELKETFFGIFVVFISQKSFLKRFHNSWMEPNAILYWVRVEVRDLGSEGMNWGSGINLNWFVAYQLLKDLSDRQTDRQTDPITSSLFPCRNVETFSAVNPYMMMMWRKYETYGRTVLNVISYILYFLNWLISIYLSQFLIVLFIISFCLVFLITYNISLFFFFSYLTFTLSFFYFLVSFFIQIYFSFVNITPCLISVKFYPFNELGRVFVYK